MGTTTKSESFKKLRIIYQINMIEFYPLGNRVLIQQFKDDEKTASGILLTGSAIKEKNYGEIIAIGNGEEVLDSKTKIGDIVLYKSYSGTEVESKKDDKKLIIVEVSDIIAVVLIK